MSQFGRKDRHSGTLGKGISLNGLERGKDGTRASGDLLGFGRVQKDYR
jgi:hypothetical protein